MCKTEPKTLWATLLISTIVTSLLPIEKSYSQQTLPLSPTRSYPRRLVSPVGPLQVNIGPVALHQALLDLSNPWTVMCVAAHPDDEDGTTLTVLRRKHGVHTVSIFSTYGEGGQNAVGPELYEDLGVIRARETQAAADIQGSEPYFLGLKDFGYSKSAEEAFRVWGHEEALRRLVLKIRELQPDVIITNHDTTRGHGHHQATGRLVLEAFDASADPTRFSEQLSKAGTWQPQRLFVRIFSPRSSTAEATAQPAITVDPNEKDEISASSFAEQALKALQEHASQGPWPKTIHDWLRMQNNQTGKLNLIRYRLARGAKKAAPLPSRATTFFDGLEVPRNISARLLPVADVERLSEHLNDPSLVLKALISWRNAQPSLSTASPSLLGSLNARADRALAVAAKASLTINPQTAHLVAGDTAKFSIGVANAGAETIQLRRLVFEGWGETVPLQTADVLLPDTATSVEVERKIPLTAPITVPKDEHLYDGLLCGPQFTTRATLAFEDATFSVTAATRLDITPPVEILEVSPSPWVLTPATSRTNLNFAIKLRNNRMVPFTGKLRVSSGDTPLQPIEQAVTFKPRSIDNQRVSVKLAPRGRLPESGRALFSIADVKGFPLTRSEVPVVYSDARVAPNRRVGYLSSFDETLQQSLAALKVSATPLSTSGIVQSRLRRFDTIIIDNRGYEAHPELSNLNRNLLRFVEQGGTLIVFYHKDNEWNGRSGIAPYSIVLGEERVTDESAPVRFLVPNHPLLTNPNRIGPADFDDWIQERGLYYPNSWDNHYVALLSSNDPGEKPLDGGLLVARYGRGNYIYTSMVWYRQLRAGVPGAYRMLANMVSYGSRHSR